MKTYELKNNNVTFSHPEFKAAGILKDGQYGPYVMFKEAEKVLFCNPYAKTAKGLKGLIINVISECEPDIPCEKYAWMSDYDWVAHDERQKESDIELYHYLAEKEYQDFLELEKNKEKYQAKKQLYISKLKGCTCERCGGSGRVRFNYANGVCFKCFGTGKM